MIRDRKFDFETWITIYPDLMDKYNSMPEESRREMKEIVTEMFRRGFRLGVEGKIFCGKCEMEMDFQITSDDLMGNLRDYYKCPKCGIEVYIIVAEVRE